jgi:hypothetical protein
VKDLNLVYSQLLIFTSSFVYAVRVNEVFTEIVNYLHSYLKRISGIRLIVSIQVVLSITFHIIKNIVYAGVLISVVVYINFEFTNNLDLLIIIG